MSSHMHTYNTHYTPHMNTNTHIHICDDDDDDGGDAMACKWGMGAWIRRRAGWQNRTFFNTAQVHSCDDSPPDEGERFAFYNGLLHGCVSFVMRYRKICDISHNTI